MILKLEDGLYRGLMRRGADDKLAVQRVRCFMIASQATMYLLKII